MISIIIPIIRPRMARRCMQAIAVDAGIPADQYEIITGEDAERIGAPKMVKKLVGKISPESTAVCFLGDDTVPQWNFLKYAIEDMQKLPDGWGLVGINDNIRMFGTNTAAHWLADVRLLDLLDGELFHTGYRHCYCDNELTNRCEEMGRYIFSERSFVFHDHPAVDKTKDDPDYRRVYSNDCLTHDLMLYRRRKSNGWKGAEK